MNRLTYNPHRKDNTYMVNQNKEDYDISLYKCVDKLGQLEDIEEELGIDLIKISKEQGEKIKELLEKEKLNHKGYESNTITSNFKDFEINSSPSKTIISCEGCYCFEGTSGTNMNRYDTEEIIENCTVKIWSNSNTGNVKIGWWRNDN